MFYYDPVCGRKINRNKAYARVKYQDEIYYLCCPKCQSEFEKDPKKYLMKGKHKRRKPH
ncbi:MAG: YHS domain-containing protein [bacterium]